MCSRVHRPAAGDVEQGVIGTAVPLCCPGATFEPVSHERGGSAVPLSPDPAKRQRQLANLRNFPAAPHGNQRHLTHGAYAAVPLSRIDAKVREMFEAIAADAPVRDADGGLPAADALPVRMLAEVLCRLDSIADYVNRRGWEDEDGNPRSVLDYEHRLRSQAVELMKELGMTPAARAKLGLDLVRGFSAAEQLGQHLQGRYG